MEVRIHNGDDDYIDLTGDTVDDIRKQADYEAEKRGWKIKNLWSEEISR